MAGDPDDSRSMPLCPDSAEFCPAKGQRDLLAVSMYELNEVTQERVGKVQLYQLLRNNDGLCSLQDLCSMDCSGVFDLTWQYGTREDSSSALAALALADGSCRIVSVNALRIEHVASATEAASSGMATSVDWFPQDQHEARLVVSSSDGSIGLNQLAAPVATTVTSWSAHDLEVWTVVTTRHQVDLAFSGSDDCSLKGWDVRNVAQPAFVNRRDHSAGVCCIQAHPTAEHVLGTGSYDGNARIWDLRNLRRPLCTSKVDTGGGVWRFKWHPQDPCLAVLACMHNGFCVLHVDAAFSDASVFKYAHQMVLGYGADWWHGEANVVATCSFYDKTLHVWRTDALLSSD